MPCFWSLTNRNSRCERLYCLLFCPFLWRCLQNFSLLNAPITVLTKWPDSTQNHYIHQNCLQLPVFCYSDIYFRFLRCNPFTYYIPMACSDKQDCIKVDMDMFGSLPPYHQYEPCLLCKVAKKQSAFFQEKKAGTIASVLLWQKPGPTACLCHVTEV